MRKCCFALAIFFLGLSVTTAFAASNLEEGVGQLAQQISKSMEEKKKQKIAIIDFSDLNGNVTALGQFMAEELTTQLFIVAPGKFEVVERRQLMKLEEELMLSQTGFIEEKGIKKMGQVFGVDAIVTGSITDLGNTIKINARLVAVESAKVVAVAATDIPKTGMVADLIGKQVMGRQTIAENKPVVTESAKKGVTPYQQKYEADDFIFELQSCSGMGLVSCDLLITNNGNNRNLELWIGDKTNRIIDDTGNEYAVSGIQLANKRNERPKSLIRAGIPTKARLSFNNVSKEISTIALFEIALSEGRGKNEFKIQFRNIPLSK